MPRNCRHLPVPCSMNAAVGFVTTFKWAFLIKNGSTMAPILLNLVLTRRLDKLKALFGGVRADLKFAVALALINSSYKVFLCLGRRICEKFNLKEDKVPFFAGFLSGLFLGVIE